MGARTTAAGPTGDQQFIRKERTPSPADQDKGAGFVDYVLWGDDGKSAQEGAVMADAKAQSDKFKETARKLECDEDEARSDERLKKVAKSKSEPEIP